MICPR